MIRRAAYQDAEAICSIWNHYIKKTTVTFTTTAKTVQGIEALIFAQMKARNTFLVAMKETRVIGFALYDTFRSGPGYQAVREHTVMVHPAYIGQGVGMALFHDLERHAIQSGIRYLVAGVSGENKAALLAHARYGFAEVGRMPSLGEKFGRSIDLVLLQKQLQCRTDKLS